VLLCLVWVALVCGNRVESNPHRAEPGERAGEVQHPPPGRVPACPRDQRSGNGVGGEDEQTHGEKVPSTQTWHAGNLLTSSRNGGDVARPDLGTLRAGRPRLLLLLLQVADEPEGPLVVAELSFHVFLSVWGVGRVAAPAPARTRLATGEGGGRQSHHTRWGRGRYEQMWVKSRHGTWPIRPRARGACPGDRPRPGIRSAPDPGRSFRRPRQNGADRRCSQPRPARSGAGLQRGLRGPCPRRR